MKKLLFILLTFLALMIALVSGAQDTVRVKKVYLNGKVVKVKSGYIIKQSDGTWKVNNKKVRLSKYKPTESEAFKPDTVVL